MSEPERTRAPRRVIAKPTKATERKGKMVERYRQVLLDNTSMVCDQLNAWNGLSDLTVEVSVSDKSELVILADYFRGFEYLVEASVIEDSSSPTSFCLVFHELPVDVKLSDVIQPVIPKKRKGAKKASGKE